MLKGNYFEFAKGYVEEGEDEKETVKREIGEETGIKDIEFIDGFREIYTWDYKFKEKLISREVILYLVETKTEKVKISFEHDAYKWLTYNEAIKIIKYKNMKEVLEKANNFLNSPLRKFI